MRYVLQVKYGPPLSLLFLPSIDSFGHVHLCLGTSCVQNAVLEEQKEEEEGERETQQQEHAAHSTKRYRYQNSGLTRLCTQRQHLRGTQKERERGEGLQTTDELRAGQKSDHRVWSQGRHLKT